MGKVRKLMGVASQGGPILLSQDMCQGLGCPKPPGCDLSPEMDALWERGGRKPSVPPLRVFSDPWWSQGCGALAIESTYISSLGVLQKKKKKHLQAKSLAYVALQLTRNS